VAKPAQPDISNEVPSAAELPPFIADSKPVSSMEMRLRSSEDVRCLYDLEDNAPLRISANQCGTDNDLLQSQTSRISAWPSSSQKKGFPLFL